MSTSTSKPLKPKRGTTAQNNAYTGEAYEVTLDTDKKTLVCHDGLTAGGFPLAKEEELSSLDSTLRALIAKEVGDAESMVSSLDTTLRALIAEELAKYLPLAGGTLTGAINSAVSIALKRIIDTDGLVICGGSDIGKNSFIQINGGDKQDGAGIIQIHPRLKDGTGAYYNFGPDGGISLNGETITRYVSPTSSKITAAIGASGTSYTASTDGFMMVVGETNRSSATNYIRLVNSQGLQVLHAVYSQTYPLVAWLPVKKGDVINLQYNGVALSSVAFYKSREEEIKE